MLSNYFWIVIYIWREISFSAFTAASNCPIFGCIASTIRSRLDYLTYRRALTISWHHLIRPPTAPKSKMPKPIEAPGFSRIQNHNDLSHSIGRHNHFLNSVLLASLVSLSTGFRRKRPMPKTHCVAIYHSEQGGSRKIRTWICPIVRATSPCGSTSFRSRSREM